jgi:hypothetical protein
MAESEKFVLFWVYGDEEDSPYTLRSPTENLQALLTEWTGWTAATLTTSRERRTSGSLSTNGSRRRAWTSSNLPTG